MSETFLIIDMMLGSQGLSSTYEQAHVDLDLLTLAEENGQESKTVITAVDELLQFAKDVNAGKYDNRTNAVVSLEADLDLTGVEWTPIGCTNEEGDVEHYFSGKFYGNGHSISNIDYASMYGKEDIGGLFGFLGGD